MTLWALVLVTLLNPLRSHLGADANLVAHYESKEKCESVCEEIMDGGQVGGECVCLEAYLDVPGEALKER